MLERRYLLKSIHIVDLSDQVTKLVIDRNEWLSICQRATLTRLKLLIITRSKLISMSLFLSIVIRIESPKVPSQTLLSTGSVQNRRGRQRISEFGQSRAVFLNERQVRWCHRIQSRRQVGRNFDIFFELLQTAGAAEWSLDLFHCVQVVNVYNIRFLLF